jgi:hypothetical protein
MQSEADSHGMLGAGAIGELVGLVVPWGAGVTTIGVSLVGLLVGDEDGAFVPIIVTVGATVVGLPVPWGADVTIGISTVGLILGDEEDGAIVAKIGVVLVVIAVGETVLAPTMGATVLGNAVGVRMAPFGEALGGMALGVVGSCNPDDGDGVVLAEMLFSYSKILSHTCSSSLS